MSSDGMQSAWGDAHVQGVTGVRVGPGGPQYLWGGPYRPNTSERQ